MAKTLPELLAHLDRGIAALISDMKQERPENMTETELVAAASGFLFAAGIKVARENNCPREVADALIKEILDKTYVESETSIIPDESGEPTPRDPSASKSESRLDE